MRAGQGCACAICWTGPAQSGAIDVGFSGLDRAAIAATPNFAKALAIDHARDGDVMVAYEMNGADLPMLNGFPLRLVVPGWYATYWVKALSQIQVLPEKFHGFWMDKAYRIPTSPDASESSEHLAAETTPINRMSLRSLFVRPEPGEQLSSKAPFEMQGLAFDSGSGIQRVEVSTDRAAPGWLPSLIRSWGNIPGVDGVFAGIRQPVEGINFKCVPSTGRDSTRAPVYGIAVATCAMS